MMTKNEYDEMLAINAALDGEYDAVMEDLKGLFEVFGLEGEDFTKKGLMDFMGNMLKNDILPNFILNSKLNRRELKISKVLKRFDDEIGNVGYKIVVQSFLGKEKKIDSIIVPFLKYIRSGLKESMYFEDLIISVKTRATYYAKKECKPYIDDLKKYEWDDAYKKENTLKTPDWAEIYKEIVKVYKEDYVLTKEAYETGIIEWINGTNEAVSKTTYQEYEVNIKELSYYIKQYFKKLPEPKLSEVYKGLEKNTLSFFEKGIGSDKDVLLDYDGRKYVSQKSLQKFVQEKFMVPAPKLDDDILITIKSNQLIPNSLGAKTGFKWLANALANSVNENSPLYMKEQLDVILVEGVDLGTVREKVKSALITWGRSVYEILGTITDDSVPLINSLKTDLSRLFKNYKPLSGKVCGKVMELLLAEIDINKWDSLVELCQHIQDNVFNANIAPTRELFELWWDYFDGQLEDITSEMMVNSCLPAPARIKEYFTRNVCLASKDSIIQTVNKWKSEVKDPFVNAAAPLSDFKDIEKTKFSGIKLKDEYWGTLFPEDERLVYFKDTICASIQNKDGLTALELDIQWNLGVDALKADTFWKEHLFPLYLKNQDVSILESWERSNDVLLPSVKSFTPLIIKILLKLPINKREKKPNYPIMSDKSLNGFITLFDKWNFLFHHQHGFLSETLQLFYHVFSEISETRRDVKQNFDKFISDCNSELEATYDSYNFLSGTLGSLAKVAVIAGIAVCAIPAAASGGVIAAITTAVGAVGAGTVVVGSLAGDLVSGASKIITGNYQPKNYNSEVKTTIKAVADYSYEEISKVIDNVSNRIKGIDEEIREVAYLLTEIKIADIDLDVKYLNTLEKFNNKIVKEYNSIKSYIEKLDDAVKKVDLSTIEVDFEGYMLKNFILKNINSGWDNILGSRKFKDKLIKFEFCKESDFYDSVWPGDAWADDVDRLRTNVRKYNPHLFK